MDSGRGEGDDYIKIMAQSFKREVMGRSVDITAWKSSYQTMRQLREAVPKI